MSGDLGPSPRIAVQNGRATVSLGALTRHKHCTFSCPFCYVTGDFRAGGTVTADAVCAALSEVDLDGVDTILVSGDTDSFAPPRAMEAVRLLSLLPVFGKDVAFTTRALLPEAAFAELNSTARGLSARGRQLIAITSLTQWSRPALEPPPIPAPAARIHQLSRLRSAGLRVGVALRPLLPVVPLSDYERLIGAAAEFTEFVLVGTWFTDRAGTTLHATLGEGETTPHEFRIAKMDFDSNEAVWLECRSIAAEARCAARACELGIPLFDRSQAAFAWLNTRREETHE